MARPPSSFQSSGSKRRSVAACSFSRAPSGSSRMRGNRCSRAAVTRDRCRARFPSRIRARHAVLTELENSSIRFVNTRHEQVAAHAADGYTRATGKTGVVLSHLGPGLTNAATGVATAALDSIPMVVIAGDIPTHFYGKHPHQE